MKLPMHRVVAAAMAGVGAALATAVGLTVFDLYLTGHGHDSIARPWLESPGLGVHLSRADAVMLLVTGAAAVVGARAARGAR
jgi:hypothetical protein